MSGLSALVAEEHLQLLNSGWPGKIRHNRHILREQLHPFSREVVAQKLDAGRPEDALLHIGDQPVLLKAGEELVQVDGVVLRVVAGHVHVVHVGEDRLQVRHLPVHFPLESGAGILEPERHPQILGKSKRRG